MFSKRFLGTVSGCLFASILWATVFGSVRGIVHDPQHRPVQGALVTLQSQSSDWVKTIVSGGEGEFQLLTIPLGRYTVSVSKDGFAPMIQTIVVQSGSAVIFHFQLTLAELNQSVDVSAAPAALNPDSATTEHILDRRQIERIPGADQTNSLAMITDTIPGATIVHDQLHIRGGHQVSWLVDGVPVPNTSIASNVGPQFDPKDIDTLEVQTGGYSAEYGDRTFAVFNVVPRSGFERNNDAELVLSLGNFHETNNQFSVGGHSTRFAYLLSVDGNRTDLGLQTPVAPAFHDQAAGAGVFSSLIFNANPSNQLRLVASARRDHYQIPNSEEQQTLGIRDTQEERDSFLNFSWVRTIDSSTVLTVSPFYHYNRAAYRGGPGDTPVIPEHDRASHFAGAQVLFTRLSNRHNVRLGFYGFAERDHTLFGLTATDGSDLALRQQQTLNGNLEAVFAEDQFKPASWLTLTAGVRATHFSASLAENAVSPRLGAAVQIPRLKWVARGSYGRYYQAPPLSTVSGPLLNLALEQGFAFLPLRGERDEQWEVGLAIPVGGWIFDFSRYHTRAGNYFDHDVLGNSNIFFPLTIAGARFRGLDASIRSPQLFHRLQFHLAYSHQYAQGKGGITGGLTDFSPPADGFFFLDHDQRDTLSTGIQSDLPYQSWAALHFSYGSGFLDGDGPGHLTQHSSFDFSAGKSFEKKLSVEFTALNLFNHRYLLDNSNTFGGTHFNYPRQISVTLRYRFHY